MKWKDTHPATKNVERIQFPRYKEEDWWIMEDILREVKLKTMKYIHTSVAGKIARELGLVKREKNVNVYHKSLVKYLIKHLEEYYG